MAKERAQVLQDLVNASGFVFQLGLEHRIRETQAMHGWQVLSREHPWSNGNDSGFADLVLGQGIIRIVVECKRPRDGTWVFLVAEDSKPVRRCRCQWFSTVPNRRDLVGWADFPLQPPSLEADFCIIRGQGEGDRSMLERLAAGLLEALPPLATEEASLKSNRGFATELIYLPVIVTTAALEVCRFAPNDIDVSVGTLGVSHFEPVQVLRFRKSLAHDISENAQPVDIGSIAREKERTVLVCSADFFPEFLKQLNIEGSRYDAPWVTARQLEERGS